MKNLFPPNMNLYLVSASDSEQVNAARKKDGNRLAPTMERCFLSLPLASKMPANLPRICFYSRKLKYECRGHLYPLYNVIFESILTGGKEHREVNSLLFTTGSKSAQHIQHHQLDSLRHGAQFLRENNQLPTSSLSSTYYYIPGKAHYMLK